MDKADSIFRSTFKILSAKLFSSDFLSKRTIYIADITAQINRLMTICNVY